MGNILRKDVNDTVAKLIADVFPQTFTEGSQTFRHNSTFYKAGEYLLKALVTGSKTLVSDLA